MSTKLDGLTEDQRKNGTPEDKIIIIKSLFSKEAKMKLQPPKNSVNGRYIGIETNVSDMEKMKRGYLPDENSEIIIQDGYTFNLDDPQDALDWNWVQNSRHIAKDFEAAQNTGLSEAWFYVYRPGAESRKKVSEMEYELELMNKIAKDSETNLYNRVRLMGIDMSGQPLSDVKEYLMTAVKDRARRKDVSAVYENADVSLKLMLYHGLDNNIITFDGFTYKFGNVVLGHTEDSVIKYFNMTQNLSIVKSIENAVYNMNSEPDEAPKEDPLAKARAAKAAKNKKKE